MDRIRIGYPAGYLRFFRIRIGFGYSFLKTNGSGSGYWFDFYNEIFLRGIQDVRNDGGSVFFAMVFILTTCVALIRTNGNSCYFIVFSGQVEVVSCSYIASMLLCLLC